MKQRELVAQIARRLPFTTRRQVEEMIEVLTELWGDELVLGGEVIIPGIGRLMLETQQMKRGGVMKEKGTSIALLRIYGRFHPSPALHQRVRERIHDET